MNLSLDYLQTSNIMIYSIMNLECIRYSVLCLSQRVVYLIIDVALILLNI